MSIRAIVWAFDAQCPTPAAKLVLIKLADHANDEGECWPAQKRIAADCGLTRQTVNQQIGVLVNLGLIRVEQRFNGTGQQTNRYFLLCRQIRHPLSADQTPPVGKTDTPLSAQPTPPVGLADTEPSMNRKEEGSVPNGTAKAAPEANGHDDLAAEVFTLGVRILTRRGVPERQARTIIGGHRKTLHDDAKLLTIMASVERNNPVEPIGYLAKAVGQAVRPDVTPFGSPGFA